MRTAVLAAIALALTATAVSARPEPVQTVPSLRAQSWNLEIATRRPAMRTRVSHGELKTKTLVQSQPSTSDSLNPSLPLLAT
jgi:hypothetical protein